MGRPDRRGDGGQPVVHHGEGEDGFSRTYGVDENTVVNSGRDGIGPVKSGDTVQVAGLVEGGNARAATIVDSTILGKIGEHWGFPKRK